MYQEYHDWEKSFKNEAANGNAKIDAEKVWTNVKPHIPTMQKKRGWMPVLLFLCFCSLATAAWLGVKNGSLRNQNEALHAQLVLVKANLFSCQKQQRSGIDNNMTATIKNDFTPLASNLALTPKIKQPITKSTTQSRAENSENYQEPQELKMPDISHVNLINKMNSEPLDQLQRLTSELDIQKKNVVVHPFSSNKKSISNPTDFFLNASSFLGGSSLKGSYATEGIQWNNQVDYQWGLQLSMAKFLTPHWYISANLQYMVLNHRSNISSISSDRTEVNGTTKIYIDSNGNTTSITGTTGATTYHQINAKLFNQQHQWSIGPSLGYIFYAEKGSHLSIYTSALWLLANQSQGRAPIGALDGPGSLNGQWEYKQVSPTVSLGLSVTKPVGKHWSVLLGGQASMVKDRFFLNDKLLDRQGYLWNIVLGLQNKF